MVKPVTVTADVAVKNAFGNIPRNVFNDYEFNSSYTPAPTSLQNSKSIETDVKKYLDSNERKKLQKI